MRPVLLLTLFAGPVLAQNSPIPNSIAGSEAVRLSFVEGQLLSVAEAMPDAKYSFIPTAGKFDDARSFGEQIKHVAWESRSPRSGILPITTAS
jgi:hypothetical protein